MGLLKGHGSPEWYDRQLEALRFNSLNGRDAIVIYADVDDLKTINDTAGHAAGDELLREVARRLRFSTRVDDILARIGGDEFVVVTTTRNDDAATTDAVDIRVRANAFLHHMVRNIAGSLILVGRGERTVDWLSAVLQGRDRCEAGPTAPPEGLYFVGADYPAGFGLPSGKLRRPPTGAAS